MSLAALVIPEQYKVRSVASVKKSQDYLFYIGTVGDQESNKVFLIQFDDDTSSLQITETYEHASEVWKICSSPKNADYFATASWDGTVRIQNKDQTIQEISNEGRPCNLYWNKQCLAAAYQNAVFLYDSEQFQQINQMNLPQISASLNDPNHKQLHGIATENNVLLYDTRDSCQRFIIQSAHNQKILDLNFNPNNPYHIATASQDTSIKFWDFRKPNNPIKLITEHQHWVWQVKYNNFHDQLLLSSSSDNSVILHRAVSTSSAPVDESFSEKEPDCTLVCLDDFDDSVYTVEWCAKDAWFFICCSYNGKVAMYGVPNEEKYRILLQVLVKKMSKVARCSSAKIRPKSPLLTTRQFVPSLQRRDNRPMSAGRSQSSQENRVILNGLSKITQLLKVDPQYIRLKEYSETYVEVQQNKYKYFQIQPRGKLCPLGFKIRVKQGDIIVYMSLRNPNPSKLMQHAIIKEREFQIREKTMRFEVENIYFSLFGKQNSKVYISTCFGKSINKKTIMIHPQLDEVLTQSLAMSKNLLRTSRRNIVYSLQSSNKLNSFQDLIGYENKHRLQQIAQKQVQNIIQVMQSKMDFERK